jgi:hypothetical protein
MIGSSSLRYEPITSTSLREDRDKRLHARALAQRADLISDGRFDHARIDSV